MEFGERRVSEIQRVKSVHGWTVRHVCHAEWLGVIALATVVAFILAQRFGWF